MNIIAKWFGGLTIMASIVLPALADDVIVIEGAEIRGNQEQPKILYIVPWQRPLNRQGLEADALKLVGSDLFNPLFRDEFLRQVAYYEMLQPANEDLSKSGQTESK